MMGAEVVEEGACEFLRPDELEHQASSPTSSCFTPVVYAVHPTLDDDDYITGNGVGGDRSCDGDHLATSANPPRKQLLSFNRRRTARTPDPPIHR